MRPCDKRSLGNPDPPTPPLSKICTLQIENVPSGIRLIGLDGTPSTVSSVGACRDRVTSTMVNPPPAPQNSVF
ncbi:unnamed protein product [Mesocestoides corti]|uniref:Uncharacterized protein n=1 Tax=Mesocestoides corti TaxID=53468 RepID=A0A0R3U1S1_MESCO|nr:unnamed protein product [Mesocestoides corti]